LTAGDVYRALWRHKLFIVVLTAMLVGATWYVTSRETREYEASTLVRVQERGPRAGDAGAALQAARTLAQTYAKLVGSGALREEIGTLIARCTRAARSQRSAAPERANARLCEPFDDVTNGRISPRNVAAVPLSASAVEDLDLLTITARSENATSAMVAANAAPLALRTFIRRTGARSEQIVVAKAATSSPVSRQLPLRIAIAIALGLIFNGALALLIELFRDRLPDPDELGQVVGQPLLATIPSLRLHSARALVGPGAEREAVVAVPDLLDGEADTHAASPRR
jgi:capsular polysaccharide biosynthesis protein